MKRIVTFGVVAGLIAGIGIAQDSKKQQFILLPYEAKGDFESRSNAKSESYWASWTAYSKQLLNLGVVRGGGPLEPTQSAKTVRIRAGKTSVVAGSQNNNPEQLGGYLIIEVNSIEEAVKLAKDCPSALTGSVEVRPLAPMPNMGS